MIIEVLKSITGTLSRCLKKEQDTKATRVTLCTCTCLNNNKQDFKKMLCYGTSAAIIQC